MAGLVLRNGCRTTPPAAPARAGAKAAFTSERRPGTHHAHSSAATWPGTPAAKVPADALHKPGRPPAAEPSVRVPTEQTVPAGSGWQYPYACVLSPDARRELLSRFPWCFEPVPDPDKHLDEGAAEALRDIEQGWLAGDVPLIARHVAEGGAMAIYKDGYFSHALLTREFLALTQEAMASVRTLEHRFLRPEVISRNEVRAQAEHTFIGRDGSECCERLIYTLRRPRRRWLIAEIDLRGSGIRPPRK